MDRRSSFGGVTALGKPTAVCSGPPGKQRIITKGRPSGNMLLKINRYGSPLGAWDVRCRSRPSRRRAPGHQSSGRSPATPVQQCPAGRSACALGENFFFQHVYPDMVIPDHGVAERQHGGDPEQVPRQFLQSNGALRQRIPRKYVDEHNSSTPIHNQELRRPTATTSMSSRQDSPLAGNLDSPGPWIDCPQTYWNPSQ